MSTVTGGGDTPSALSGSNGAIKHEATGKPPHPVRSYDAIPIHERPHYKVALRVGMSVNALRYWMKDHKLSVKTTSEAELIEALLKTGHKLREEMPRSPVSKDVNAPPTDATIKALECLEKIEEQVLMRLSDGKRAQSVEVNVLQALLHLRGEDK